jgi:hypothetical protein
VHLCEPRDEAIESEPVYRPADGWLRVLGVSSVKDLFTDEVVDALPKRSLIPA